MKRGMDLAEKKLTAKQKKFADEYLKSFVPKEAAMAAGYKESGALSTAKRLLENSEVCAYLKNAVQEIHDQNDKWEKEITAYLVKVLKAEDDSISTRERMKAAELLGKNLGLFQDKKALSDAKMVNIIDDIRESAD